jgi:hypothetical protein
MHVLRNSTREENGSYMNYLQPHTVNSIIRSAFGILFRNWPTLFLIFMIPALPIQLLKLMASGQSATINVILAILDFMVTMFATFPVTVAVSEVCIGIKPSVLRSYRRAFANAGRLIGTLLLFYAIFIVALIALIIPGVVFVIWSMFAAPVVVIESLGGWAALKRSRELGRGHYLRNFGIALLVLALALMLTIVVALTLVAAAFLLGFRQDYVGELLGALSALAILPAYTVSLVLLYYDMRACKEGYGATQLAEDIRF